MAKLNKPSNPKGDTVELVALRNTFLPDGTFIGKDARVTVGPDYAVQVLAEPNSPFRKV